MQYSIEEIFSLVSKVFVFCLGIVFIYSLIDAHTDTVKITERVVNEKYNVTQIVGESEENQELYTMSSVLYAIETMPEELDIYIDSYYITEEDKFKIREENDASNLLLQLNPMFSYNPEYGYNEKGELVQITYHSVY